MRNRPFTLPNPKSDILPGSDDWGNLKNKFSGKTLFRYNLFHLETGNLSVLDNINNNSFLEELFTYSRKYNDLNLIPALKKIAGDNEYSESIRQRASEITETIEEHSAISEGKIASGRSDGEKEQAARRILAGIRYPQTTDILRLLRENSVELKRLALFLIGKFNLTDMIQEVCECLNTPGIEKDAFSVLVFFGNTAGNELNRFYLMSSGNITLSRTIVRICAQSCPPDSLPFLTERLWSNPRQIREIALKALIKCGYKAVNDDREKLNRLIFETFSLLARITSDKMCLAENDNMLLYGVLDKEYCRWKDFLLNLLFLTYGNEIPVPSKKDNSGKEEHYARFIPELVEIIYGDSVEARKLKGQNQAVEKKRFKRLQRYFACEVPQYKDLLENIINYDYNILSIWTKASTLRYISEIDNEDLGESVVALLFSPEELLRQEAAQLIARSGRELYTTTSERIPESARKGLDRIISGMTDKNELLFEKTGFLASIFPDILEDELLYLAERMKFIKKDHAGDEPIPSGGLLWSIPENKREAVISVIADREEMAGAVRDKLAGNSFLYLLPFDVIEDFTFQFPGSSYRVMKFIDDKEE